MYTLGMATREHSKSVALSILLQMSMVFKSSTATPSVTPSFNATETSDDTPALQYRPWLKILLWTFYSLIFLLGVGGNSAVCFILQRRKSLRTVTNLFILNLAISDLIFSCTIPLEFPIIVHDYKWPYAPFFCKIYGPFQTVALSVSIFTLAAVSIVRHRAIIHPLKRQVTQSHARYILAGIWLSSAILMVPHSLTLKSDGIQCNEQWPDQTYRKVYTTSLSVLFYVIPLCIIMFAYVKIVKELMSKRSCFNCENSALNEVWNKETTKVIRMFFKVTIVFAVCNLPSQIMWLWLDYGKADQTFKYFWDLLAAMNILIFANSAANPFIYYIFHDRFRNEAIRFLSEYKWFVRLRKLWSSDSRNNNERSLVLEKEPVVNGIKKETENSGNATYHALSNMLEKTYESCV
jgi:uncharacterized membrane-anchored protein YitT (DUF2179 family)